MARIETVKTNFTAGEISPELMGRSDLKLYQNGAKTLENVFVQPTGGIIRRHGLRYIDTLAIPEARLIPFEKNGVSYLLVLLNASMRIYDSDGTFITSLVTPWSTAQNAKVVWAQGPDSLLLIHPDVHPLTLSLTGSTWLLYIWLWDSGGGMRVAQPYHKFAATGTTIAASATSGLVTLTASAPVFDAAHAATGVRFRVYNKEMIITAVASATSATASVLEPLPTTAATADWVEAAFSAVHGWPTAVGFHQNRLVIGGSRDLPNRLFMSKTSSIWNFDQGTGLDDEAISFGILSDQSNAIKAVMSSRHLQIFTTGGEWMVTGSPLTPRTIQLQKQTRIGSRSDVYIQPLDADGATYFVSRDGRQLREFFYSEIEGAYAATDLAVTARHMVDNAVDMTYDAKNRMLHAVLAGGTLSTLTVYRNEGVNAWTRQVTDGQFKAVRAIGDKIYVLVLRTEGLFLERFDEAALLDASRILTSGSPATSWGGFSYVPTRTLSIVANNIVYNPVAVSAAAITTPVAATSLQAGLPFTVKVRPLPPPSVNFAAVRAVRLTRVTFRLKDTAVLRADTGVGGLRSIALQGTSLPAPYTYLPRVTGDVATNASGWVHDSGKSLWSIENNVAQPFNLLSVTATMKVSD